MADKGSQGEGQTEENRPSYLDTEAAANRFKRGTQETPKLTDTTFDDRSEEGKAKRKTQAVQRIIEKVENIPTGETNTPKIEKGKSTTAQ